MRLGEIARLEWRDIQVENGWVVIRKSKTRRRRVTPLNSMLKDRLLAVKRRRANDRVLKHWPSDEAKWNAAARGIIRKLCRELCEADPPIPSERISWNAWRHTWATLLVQAGVSIDKVSAYMGNTPIVCRKHYAEFARRDEHDTDIELL